MPPVKKLKATASTSVEVEDEIRVVSGQLKKKLTKQQKQKRPQRGVVYIKHLPHGFFEEQLQSYFEQFGNVTRLRVVRSKYTGGSKGYAFVEFEYPEVAEVAAETMNNYLMFNKVVKAEYIPPEKQRFNYFRSTVRQVRNKAGKPIYVSRKTAAVNRKVKQINDWTEDAYQKRTANKLGKIKQLNQKYAHLGIDFNKIVTGSKMIEAEISEQNETASKEVPVTKATKQKIQPTVEAIEENHSKHTVRVPTTVKTPVQKRKGATLAESTEKVKQTVHSEVKAEKQKIATSNAQKKKASKNAVKQKVEAKRSKKA